MPTVLGHRGYSRYRYRPPAAPKRWFQDLEPSGASELLELLEREEAQQREETVALLELLNRQRRDIAVLRQQQQQLLEQLEGVQLDLKEQRQQNQQLRHQLLTLRKLRCTDRQGVLKRLASAEAAFERELETYFLPQSQGGPSEGGGPSGAPKTFFSPSLTQQQKEGAAQKILLKQQLQQQQQQQQLRPSSSLLSSSSTYTPGSSSVLPVRGPLTAAAVSRGPSPSKLKDGGAPPSLISGISSASLNKTQPLQQGAVTLQVPGTGAPAASGGGAPSASRQQQLLNVSKANGIQQNGAPTGVLGAPAPTGIIGGPPKIIAGGAPPQQQLLSTLNVGGDPNTKGPFTSRLGIGGPPTSGAPKPPFPVSLKASSMLPSAAPADTKTPGVGAPGTPNGKMLLAVPGAPPVGSSSSGGPPSTMMKSALMLSNAMTLRSTRFSE